MSKPRDGRREWKKRLARQEARKPRIVAVDYRTEVGPWGAVVFPATITIEVPR